MFLLSILFRYILYIIPKMTLELFVGRRLLVKWGEHGRGSRLQTKDAGKFCSQSVRKNTYTYFDADKN